MFQEGRTALLIACWRGFLSIVVILIKFGANTNAQDRVRYNFKLVIGVHEIEDLVTLLLAHCPLSSLAYPMITHNPLVAGN